MNQVRAATAEEIQALRAHAESHPDWPHSRTILSLLGEREVAAGVIRNLEREVLSLRAAVGHPLPPVSMAEFAGERPKARQRVTGVTVPLDERAVGPVAVTVDPTPGFDGTYALPAERTADFTDKTGRKTGPGGGDS